MWVKTTRVYKRLDRQISRRNLNQFISGKSRKKAVVNKSLIKVKRLENLDIIENVDGPTPLIVVAFKIIMTDKIKMCV